MVLFLHQVHILHHINTQGSGRVASISELVLGRVTANSIEVYFTSAGSPTATLATFSLNFNSAPATNVVSPSSFSPLPMTVLSVSSQLSSANSFTTHSDETASFDFSGELARFHSLPIAPFNSGLSNSEPVVMAAEFSSPSGSSLEVIATLVLGLNETQTMGSTEGETDFEGMATADPASDRDLLVTGVLQTPIQEHLQGRTSLEAATEILFSSPLELFDTRDEVVTGRSKREDSEEVSSRVPAPDASTPSSNPVPAKLPLPPSKNSDRASLQLDRPEPESDLSLDDPESASLSPQLCALIACLASVVPLTRRLDPKRRGKRHEA